MAGKGEQIRQLTDARKIDVPSHFDGGVAVPVLQVQLDGLREARQIVDAQHGAALILVFHLANVRQH